MFIKCIGIDMKSPDVSFHEKLRFSPGGRGELCDFLNNWPFLSAQLTCAPATAYLAPSSAGCCASSTKMGALC